MKESSGGEIGGETEERIGGTRHGEEKRGKIYRNKNTEPEEKAPGVFFSSLSAARK